MAEITEETLTAQVAACSARWEPQLEDSIGNAIGGYRPHNEYCQACKPILWALAEIRRLRGEIAEMGVVEARLREALRNLSIEYDTQTEERYCLCGSNDSGTHSTACLRHQWVLEEVSDALSLTPSAAAEQWRELVKAARDVLAADDAAAKEIEQLVGSPRPEGYPLTEALRAALAKIGATNDAR